MGVLQRKTVSFVGSAIASAALAVACASVAAAQVDPFAAAARPAPPRPGQPAPSPAAVLSPNPTGPAQPGFRTGFLSVETAVGAGYAGAQTKGFASTAMIRTLPKTAAPFPYVLKGGGERNLKGRPRIAVPTYTLAIVRQGSVRASAAGAGAELNQRATSINTILVGVDDDLAQKIADDANADLIKRLTDAGFDVVPQDQVQASKELARTALEGAKVKGVNDWTIYGARAAPLRSGHVYSKAVLAGSGASIVLNDVSVELDAVMLSPYLVLDYERLGGSGRSNYTGSASASMETRFRASDSGANFLYGAGKGKGGGMWGSFKAESTGTDELFGVMFEVDDRSDDPGVSRAFATLGLGSLYRQSKYYGVEAVPERYAALARAAYQGLNAALVDQIKKARG